MCSPKYYITLAVAAGAFQSAVSAFLQHGAAAEAGPSSGKPSSQDSAQHAAKDLHSLAEAVSRARAANVVGQADTALLRRLLVALVAAMKAAEHASIPATGDDVSLCCPAPVAPIAPDCTAQKSICCAVCDMTSKSAGVGHCGCNHGFSGCRGCSAEHSLGSGCDTAGGPRGSSGAGPTSVHRMALICSTALQKVHIALLDQACVFFLCRHAASCGITCCRMFWHFTMLGYSVCTARPWHMRVQSFEISYSQQRCIIRFAQPKMLRTGMSRAMVSQMLPRSRQAARARVRGEVPRRPLPAWPGASCCLQ